MNFNVDSLIKNNTCSNNISLRKDTLKPHGFDEMCMDKDLIEDKLYQIIDQLSKRKIAPTMFYSILLNEIHPFYDENSGICIC